MFAAVAANPARPRLSSGASSMTATVAVPVNSPADSPDTTLPMNSSGRPSSKTKHTALATENPSAARSTGRRPSRSEKLLARVSTAMTPAAYVAKMIVTIRDEKPMCS